MRIDTVHYCVREADLSANRRRRSFTDRNCPTKDHTQERLHLFSRSVRENPFLACQVQYLKTPYMTREVSKIDLARIVSVLPNLRYVDLPDGLYKDDPSSNTLKCELQARCGNIRQMKYASGAEGSFQMLAQARQWPKLEALELSHLAVDSATVVDVSTSLMNLRHIKFTSLQLLDDDMFGSLRMRPFLPLVVLEFQDIPNISARGLLVYLSKPVAKQALKSLTLANTGISPSDLSQILAAAPSLTTLRIAAFVSRALSKSQIPPLASYSLRTLHYEISSPDRSPRELSSPSNIYYSSLSSSILSGSLPSLSHLYALSASLPTMLLPPPEPAFAVNGASNANRPVNTVTPRPLRLYTKAVAEMEWDLTLISPPTLGDRRGNASVTRPMSLYLENQLSPQWMEKGRESVLLGNGFGGFLTIPSEEVRSGSSRSRKGEKYVGAWMG